MLTTLIIPLFLFALGACVGSFLNVVVYRLPRVQHDEKDNLLAAMIRSARSLAHPPSTCPSCNQRLRWYDNIPVFGWIKLAGKCRFCKQPISIRYPIVEAVTGLLFVAYYVAFFVYQLGPGAPEPARVFSSSGLLSISQPPWIIQSDWAMYLLFMFMIAALFASALIDAETFTIPLEIPWLMAVVGIVGHALIDHPADRGALNASPGATAMALGAAAGLVLSMLLLWRGVIPRSFPDGSPILDFERDALEDENRHRASRGQAEHPVPPTFTRKDLHREMRKEIYFLLPPLVLGFASGLLYLKVDAIAQFWTEAAAAHWLSGMSGAILGALAGGFTVWLVRIAGTYAFGREAMGLGDVHLMLGVGAILGAGGTVAAFFIAPLGALLIAIYKLVTGQGRELPFGPYLAIGSAISLAAMTWIETTFTPGLRGLAEMTRQLLAGWGL